MLSQLIYNQTYLIYRSSITLQKMKFSIKDFFIFCAVVKHFVDCDSHEIGGKVMGTWIRNRDSFD